MEFCDRPFESLETGSSPPCASASAPHFFPWQSEPPGLLHASACSFQPNGKRDKARRSCQGHFHRQAARKQCDGILAYCFRQNECCTQID